MDGAAFSQSALNATQSRSCPLHRPRPSAHPPQGSPPRPTRSPFIPRSQPSRPSPHPRRARTRSRPLLTRRTPRKEPARLSAEILKLLTFSSFAKHFKLYCQLAERKQKICEGATVPAVAALTLPRPMEQKWSSCRPLFSEQMCASCRTHFSVQ